MPPDFVEVRQSAWASAADHHRARVLHAAAAMLADSASAFVEDLTATVEEIAVCRACLNESAALALRSAGRTQHLPGGFMVQEMERPAGVVALIGQRSPTLQGIVAAVAPAIARGNACLIVSSGHLDPAIIALSGLLTEAGAPPGLIGVVTGPDDTPADRLATEPGIDAVRFLSSADVSAQVVQAARNAGKRIDQQPGHDAGRAFGGAACKIKSIWIPTGA
nr:aldehyde dehydrogenase family protein [Rhodovulum sp. P5]